MNHNGSGPTGGSAKSGGSSSDLDFMYGHLSELADGELQGAEETRCRDACTKLGEPRLLDRYRATRGKLQIALQGYYLSEDEIVGLQDFVADRQIRETQEAQKIEEIGRWESTGEVRRKGAILAIVVAVVFGLVYFLTPAKTSKLNPLDYFGYEAKAFEEDPDGRLDLPSEDYKEVAGYFRVYPSLGFVATPPSPPSGWATVGATVLDYELSKVAKVVYRNATTKDQAYFFAYAGSFADLPKAEQGNERGMVYQVYTSDVYNLLAWQPSEGVLAFMVGRKSARDLAVFARGP